MNATSEKAEFDARYSSEGATPVSWSEALNLFEKAEVYWLSTIHPDGKPHVTPVIAMWIDDALHFGTGVEEQKARNLKENTQVVITTGCNLLGEGLDVVIEGNADLVEEEKQLQRVADAYASKYGWTFTVRDGVLYNSQNEHALVFAVVPLKAFGFGRGEQFSHTRWSF